MALAIDGTAISSTGSGFSLALPGLTTANTNDVIITFAVTNSGGTISATSPSLTFNSRAVGGSGNNTCTELYAIAASALNNEIITINCSTNSGYITAVAYGVSGADTGSPFDSNASLPATGATSPLTVSTTATNTMIIGGFRQSSVANPAAAAGFNLISGANFLCSEYKVTTAAQNALSVGNGSNADVNGAVVDALVAVSAQSASPGTGSIVFTGASPSTNIGVFPGAGVMTLSGFVPGITIVPGPNPFHTGGRPDDDSDYSWLSYDAEEREEERKRRLAAMRREIGLLPKDVSGPVIAEADKEIESAVNVVVARQHEIDSKLDFDAVVGRYQRAYSETFRTILKNARKLDLEDAFISEVRKRVEKETKKRIRIQRDDEEVMKLLQGLL